VTFSWDRHLYNLKKYESSTILDGVSKYMHKKYTNSYPKDYAAAMHPPF
jgi:hypothetical protein